MIGGLGACLEVKVLGFRVRSTSVLYYAYGSNLCASRLARRAPSARFIGIGRLLGHDLTFHKRGRDGTGKADAAESRTDAHVWGAIAELSLDDLLLLDRFEPGYQRTMLEIISEDSVHSAWVYRAEPASIEPGLLPYRWYLDYIVRGGEARGLPTDYLNDLARTATIRDDSRNEYDAGDC